jgi:tRNA(fMet)-specific endonuclease VapC
MSRFILDTDHVSLWLQGHPAISQTAASRKTEIGVTIVTVQELFNGWMGRINDPTQSKDQVRLYTRLWTTVELLRTINVLNFDAAAEEQYQQLTLENPPLRKNRIQKDVKIAAIALSVNATLVTRNQRDFSQVPGLRLQNWV